MLGGLILRVEWLLEEKGKGEKDTVDRTEEEVEFGFDLTHPKIEAQHGWDRVSVYPARRRFNRENCFGGPPVTRETWEYDLKDSNVGIGALPEFFSWQVVALQRFMYSVFHLVSPCTVVP